MDSLFTPYRPQVLSLLRIMTGLLLLQYGTSAFFGVPSSPMFANLKMLQWPFWYAAAIELVLGFTLTIGLFSRLSAFVLSGLSAAAFFIGHVFTAKGFNIIPLQNGGTTAALFCFACLYLAAAGPGPWSVDAAMGKK